MSYVLKKISIMEEPNTWQSMNFRNSLFITEDISLKFLVPTVPKIFFSLFPTVYNTGYCLSTEPCFVYILYDYTMAMLSEKGESFQGRESCHYFGDVKLLHSDATSSTCSNLRIFSGSRCSMFLKSKPVFSRFIHRKTPKSIIIAI